MKSLPTLTILGLMLAACGAPAGNSAAPVDGGSRLATNNVAAAAPAPAPDGNASWGAAEAEDEASHRGIDFIVFNRTGRTITGIAIRPDEGPLSPGAPETPWGDNVLTQRELPDGQRAAAHKEADIEICGWQIRATFAGGETRNFPTVNLCETIRVDLR